MITDVTVATFDQEVLQSDKPVIVDFWAPWCGPCKAVAPTFEALSNEREDFKFVKVNVDDETDLAVKYGVRGIPSFAVIQKGQPVGGIASGMQTRDKLTALLARVEA